MKLWGTQIYVLSIQSGVNVLVNQSLGYVNDLVLIALEAVVVMVYAVVRP